MCAGKLRGWGWVGARWCPEKSADVPLRGARGVRLVCGAAVACGSRAGTGDGRHLWGQAAGSSYWAGVVLLVVPHGLSFPHCGGAQPPFREGLATTLDVDLALLRGRAPAKAEEAFPFVRPQGIRVAVASMQLATVFLLREEARADRAGG